MQWLYEGRERKELSQDMAAVELFEKTRAVCKKWNLHRWDAEIAAEASECELAMERFEW